MRHRGKVILPRLHVYKVAEPGSEPVHLPTPRLLGPQRSQDTGWVSEAHAMRNFFLGLEPELA